MLKIGDKMPEFEVVDQDGNVVSSKDFIGKKTIVYFYPKDNRIYILAIVLIISAILFYFYLFPIDSNIIYEKILWLNGGM